MAPKKVAAAGKENGEPVAGVENGVLAAEKTKAKPKVAKIKALGHPTTLSMVVEALKKEPEKKGTSVPAIRNRILAAHPTVDRIRLRFLLKSALNKGIEKGILVRPTNSGATGATGRFKLAKPGTKPKEESDGKTSENADPNVQPKKTEKTKEKPKKEAVKKVPKKSKADKGESKAASKPKKDTAEKTTKAPAPAKKPKAKIAAAEEGAIPKKRAVKMKAESPEKDSEEKPTAKVVKKGKK
ncbi:hypothetical protein GDO78_014611 [Eleutherodactylus coqui]|uniref:H15 domain-containing protein n=1 Tax=Eleutherodactylus coqui TaxID=57060 RepID=A0A8J6JPZ1_ELECQ|nr:hypothetical protein GDO78_014611 [Eleutherodactylus coqui]